MSTAFDDIATRYDEQFTFSQIGKAQRDRVWSYLDEIVPSRNKPLDVLELNCGTGHDAIHFAESGHRVLASDASEKMIGVAKSKTSPPGKIDFAVASFESIGETIGDKKFDLIFSNFGGINCMDTESVKTLLKKLHDHLHPGGRMVLVVMPKKCLWEKIYFRWKGKRNLSNRRDSSMPVEVVLNGSSAKTWYYSPADIAGLAGKYSVEKILPVGFFLPPSYLESFVKKHPVFFRILCWKEKMFSRPAFLANYSDHFLISLKAR